MKVVLQGELPGWKIRRFDVKALRLGMAMLVGLGSFSPKERPEGCMKSMKATSSSGPVSEMPMNTGS